MLPISEQRDLARLFTRSALNARCRNQRDNLILGAIVGIEGSVRTVATQLHARLCRYAESAWRFEAGAAPSAQHAALHAILTASDGRIPSPERLRKTISGLGQKR